MHCHSKGCTATPKDAVHIQLDALSSSALAFTAESSHTWRSLSSTALVVPAFGEQLWFCRDGVGTMISTDFYEGIRPAQQVDLDSIEGLLRPLAQAGVTKARSRESLMCDLHSFTVLERESEVLPLNISRCTMVLAVRPLHARVYSYCCQSVFVRCCNMQPKSMSSHACHKELACFW